MARWLENLLLWVMSTVLGGLIGVVVFLVASYA